MTMYYPLDIPELNLHVLCLPDALIISAQKELKAVSSALVGGGLSYCKHIVNRQVTLDYDNREPSLEMKTYLEKLGFDASSTIGLMTAAQICHFEMVSLSKDGIYVVTIATAGVSNAITAGTLYEWDEYRVGTINTMTFTNASLEDQAYINAVMTATEAKTMALLDLEIKSFIDNHSLASGTTSDAVVIASTGNGKKCSYAGTATTLGQLIGYTVRSAVKKAVETYLKQQAAPDSMV
ncbi:MAG: adenosylcobinamide amidohydrolase [Bacillota bacterium]